jgi:hypothetical protein
MKDSLPTLVRPFNITTMGTDKLNHPNQPGLAMTGQITFPPRPSSTASTSAPPTNLFLLCDVYYIDLDTDTGFLAPRTVQGSLPPIPPKWYHHWRVHLVRGEVQGEVWAHVRHSQTLAYPSMGHTAVWIDTSPPYHTAAKQKSLQDSFWMPLQALCDQFFSFLFTINAEIWPDIRWGKENPADKGHPWFHRR